MATYYVPPPTVEDLTDDFIHWLAKHKRAKVTITIYRDENSHHTHEVDGRQKTHNANKRGGSEDFELSDNSEKLKTRAEIIASAKVQIEEIDQYFADCEYWNSTRTVFETVPPDPDGKIMKLRKALAAMIAGA